MLEATLSDSVVHMTGIKGSGMVALAQILVSRGAIVRGTDVPERFYTDEILAALDIPVIESFQAENIDERTALLFYSSAYDPKTHPEIVRARERGIPCYSYTEALGFLSEDVNASAVAGVHGKSTSTALAGVIARALHLEATVVVGSKVPDFGGLAASVTGDHFLIAETCEYRRHFLDFHPDRIMVTSIEADHLDYFRDFDDIFEAFVEYALKLPERGMLVYCADDAGALSLARRVAAERPDIRLRPYGMSAEGAFRVTIMNSASGVLTFRVAAFDRDLSLRIPGRHNAVNCAGVLALMSDILEQAGRSLTNAELETVSHAIYRFRGLKRRSEWVGDEAGVTVVDDYAHHPTAITAEISALREFYPGRRIIVDFMSHTYSRTRSLLGDFASALSAADLLVLHGIYASAREKESATVSGRSLEEAIRLIDGSPEILYEEHPLDACEAVCRLLEPGDLFVTMGAGDNWQLGKAVLDRLRDLSARGDDRSKEVTT